jgi:cyclo(L-tyrosyl-L-tyrosyl) synthase
VARPLSTGCRQILDQKTHVCLGISPFNSYFTTARIAGLAAWGLREFGAVHLFVPDVPAAYTLEALGYSPERAANKARRQGQYLRNKILRALVGIGVPEPERLVLDWQRLADIPRYHELLAAAHRLFDADKVFRAACLEASAWVLDNRLPDGATATEAQRISAVRYLLAELPLFADAAGITGQESSVFCYHRSIPFLHDLYHRRLPWTPAAGQGFAVVEPVRT